MLKAGLEGIKNKMPLRAAVNENVYHFDDAKLKEMGIETLPRSLYESLQELEKAKPILDVLGKKTAEDYLRLKYDEWDAFRTTVSQWEIEKYL